ncbi:MAG: NAD(P)H-dependent oxidoreductase [Chloroflexota bacterium]
MNVLAFGASNSQNSINKALARYAGSLVDGNVELLDINDYEMPIYSADREQASGIPQEAQAFYDKIGQADGLIISFAEHNGNFTAAYKNLFDWTSRINQKVYQGKPAVFLSTSPGGHGASNVLAISTNSAPHFDADVKATLSVPAFYNNFDMETGQITNAEIQSQLESALSKLSNV